jgi:hypothetical protein
MYNVDLYAKVKRALKVENLSEREAAEQFVHYRMGGNTHVKFCQMSAGKEGSGI